MYSLKNKEIAIVVTSALQSQNIELQLPNDVEYIYKYHVLGVIDKYPYGRGEMTLAIGKEAIFSDAIPCKLLMAGAQVAPDFKGNHFYDKKPQPTKDNIVQIRYTDVNNADVAFPSGGYTVKIILECIIKGVIKEN